MRVRAQPVPSSERQQRRNDPAAGRPSGARADGLWLARATRDQLGVAWSAVTDAGCRGSKAPEEGCRRRQDRRVKQAEAEEEDLARKVVGLRPPGLPRSAEGLGVAWAEAWLPRGNFARGKSDPLLAVMSTPD